MPFLLDRFSANKAKATTKQPRLGGENNVFGILIGTLRFKSRHRIAMFVATEWMNPKNIRRRTQHRMKTESVCHRTHLVVHNVPVEVVKVQEVGEPVLAARLPLVVRDRRPHRARSHLQPQPHRQEDEQRVR